jgi:hypothetical protein
MTQNLEGKIIFYAERKHINTSADDGIHLGCKSEHSFLGKKKYQQTISTYFKERYF